MPWARSRSDPMDSRTPRSSSSSSSRSAGRTGGEAVADQPDADRERHEVLLRAVVQVALDPLALAVRSGDQPAAGGLQVHVRLSQVGERGLQRHVQAPVAQHDRQPAGDLGERPVVRGAERDGVGRPFDEDERQHAVRRAPPGRSAAAGRPARRQLAAVEQPRHPEPQPARPGHTRAAQQAQLGGVERRRNGVAVGVERARHDERAVQPRRDPAAQQVDARPGRPGPSRPPRGTAASRGASTRPGCAAGRRPGCPGRRSRRSRRAARPASGGPRAAPRASAGPPDGRRARRTPPR